MNHSKFSHGLGILLLLVILTLAGSFIVMNLWNCIITGICGFVAVSFWQALGMLALGLTLSGGLFLFILMLAHAFTPHHYDSRRELFKKWHNMTEEQRHEFLASRGFPIEKKN